MIYLLTLEDKEVKADIEPAGPGKYRVTINGETFAVSATKTEGSLYSILLGTLDANGHVIEGGTTIEADVEIAPDSIGVTIQGEHFGIGAIDERRKRMRSAAAGGAEAAGELHSPMPGKVVRILAKEGTAVKRGQGVVVVEAMKMENELAAPKDGVVAKVAVAEGQPVSGGDLLLIIQ